jgi:hypothetical protein
MTICGGQRDAPGDIIPEEPFVATWTRPEDWLAMVAPGEPPSTIRTRSDA